jgi:hypothetical protein
MPGIVEYGGYFIDLNPAWRPTLGFTAADLGLTLCKQLTEAVGAESIAAEGSAFWVELPVCAAGRDAYLTKRLDVMGFLSVLDEGLPSLAADAVGRRL